MKDQDLINYRRIEQAINYINQNFKQQPELEEVAAHLGLSPFHFQRMFSDWAGISPKKFLQYLTVQYAKSILKDKQSTLFDVAIETGLSGSSRLHDLFVTIESMTPGEYKNGGEGLHINYSFSDTIFGKVFTAATQKGLCKMLFTEDEEFTVNEFRKEFYNAELIKINDDFQKKALTIFKSNWQNTEAIKLHLKGTEFQIKVWQSLLQIPLGRLSSYGKIADLIQSPKASRAVGTAIGDNPVAYLIPCHRVVQSTGNYGEYRWGATRKKILIGWEAAQINSEINAG